MLVRSEDQEACNQLSVPGSLEQFKCIASHTPSHEYTDRSRKAESCHTFIIKVADLFWSELHLSNLRQEISTLR